MSGEVLPIDDPEPGTLKFRVEYDGPKYAGCMEAREVSSVISAMVDYAEGSLRAVADGGVSARIEIAAFESGSFDIVAIVHGAQWLLTTACGAGFFRFWWNNMRKVVVNARPLDSGDWEVTMKSGEVMHWTNAQWRAWNDRRFKKSVGKFIEPLRQGATFACFKLGDEPALSVSAADADRMIPILEPEAHVKRFTAWAQPAVVAFDPSRQWRLNLPYGGIAAKIEDKVFLEDVALGKIRIGKNDKFLLALRIEWETDSDGVESKRKAFVERVVEYGPGAEQDELPTEEDR